MVRKVIIVGGSAGGATAAARLRRLSEDVHIVLVERGEHVSYANCGLPYYIGGIIKERKNFSCKPLKDCRNDITLISEFSVKQ